MDESFGLAECRNAQEGEDVAQMLLRHGRADDAGGSAENSGRLARPDVLASGARGVVDSVLEHAGDRAVVLRRDEHEALGARDIALQSLYGLCLVLIVVLVVQRKVADTHLDEGKLLRRQLHDGVSQPAVEGILAKASYDNCDPEPAHDDPQSR
jgi:hypothetical protein